MLSLQRVQNRSFAHIWDCGCNRVRAGLESWRVNCHEQDRENAGSVRGMIVKGIIMNGLFSSIPLTIIPLTIFVASRDSDGLQGKERNSWREIGRAHV